MGCRDRGEFWWLQPLGCFSGNFYSSENPKIVMVTTPWIIFYTSTEAYIKFFCTMLKNCLWLHHYIQIDTAKVIRHEILSYWISTMFSSIMMSAPLYLDTMGIPFIILVHNPPAPPYQIYDHDCFDHLVWLAVSQKSMIKHNWSLRCADKSNFQLIKSKSGKEHILYLFAIKNQK